MAVRRHRDEIPRPSQHLLRRSWDLRRDPVITDNAACYRSRDFRHAVLDVAARHQRVKPYTPKHNGKIERYYQQILSHELLYARGWRSEQQRSQAIRTWLIHYNYHRPHTAVGDQPPASRAPQRVTNVMRNNS